MPHRWRCMVTQAQTPRAHRTFFDLLVHRPQLDLQNTADGGYGHAFAVQIDGLFLDLFRVVVAVAVGREAVVAEAAAVGLFAPGASVFRAASWSRSGDTAESSR